MKHLQWHRERPSALIPLCLILTIVCSSVFPLSAYASTPIFSGIDPSEVTESESFDLLDGVTAVDGSDHALPVTIYQILCDGAPLDVITLLPVGPAGTTYCVEYQATDETGMVYQAQRTLVSVAAPSSVPEEASPNTAPPAAPSAPEPSTPEQSLEPENLVPIPSDEPLPTAPPLPIGLPVTFRDGMHFLTDPAYPDEPILLYCMNHALAQPHPSLRHPTVPNYTEGYLTPEHFASQAQYDAFLLDLKRLLFAGYPNNGADLYKLVPYGTPQAPSPQELNHMLLLPPQLAVDFPYLTQQQFSLSRLQDELQQDTLRRFVGEVRKLWPDQITPHGLSYNDIVSTPFYKAVFCMTFSGAHPTQEEVLNAFAFLYSSAYFVTESQAYHSTWAAMAMLMHDHHIEYNDYPSFFLDELGQTLYQYARHGPLLEQEPSCDAISVEGDLIFRYNPTDGAWHSGTLTISEPSEYHGRYQLLLPEGVSVLCENPEQLYANEPFELISTCLPTSGSTFSLKSTIRWLKEVKQYTPIEAPEFQHMAGSILRRTTVSKPFSYSGQPEGSLTISKVVIGPPVEVPDEFSFVLTLSDPSIHGQYGDLTFTDGVSHFTLTDGETKTAVHLPAGTTYTVIEEPNPHYTSSADHPEGTILSNRSAAVQFENLWQTDLCIEKQVLGSLGDRTSPFHFDLTLCNPDGTPLEGDFQCLRITSDADGQSLPSIEETVTLTAGTATISLTHGQQLQITGIPFGTRYTVTEQEADRDGYTTTCTPDSDPTSGTMEHSVHLCFHNTKEPVPPTGLSAAPGAPVAADIGFGVGTLLFLHTLRALRRKGGWFHV